MFFMGTTNVSGEAVFTMLGSDPVILVEIVVPPGGGGPSRPEPQDGSMRFVVTYPNAGPFDWLIVRSGSCMTVQFRDTRTADFYYWSFGDGTTQSTSSPTIQHTYSEQGAYYVTVTVFDSDVDTMDQTRVYYLNLSTVDGTCSLPSLASLLFIPALVITIVAPIVLLAIRKSKREEAKSLRRWMLILFLSGLVLTIVFGFYAGVIRP